MPVSLAYFAAYLRKLGHEIQVIDAFAEEPMQARIEGDFIIRGLTTVQVAERIHSRTKVIVVYAINLTYHRALLSIVRECKRCYPRIPIVVMENTQAVTAYSLRRVQEELFSSGVDYILTGEAEERGSSIHPQWATLVTGVMLLQVGLFLLLYLGRRIKGLSSWLSGYPLSAQAALLVPFILVTAIYLERRAWIRLPHLNFMMKYGIMGDNPGAKWVGVNKFFRYETEKSSRVLSLSEGDYPWRPAPAGYVAIDGSLAIRSGRSTPFFHSISSYFDYGQMLKYNEVQAIPGVFVRHWRECDLESIGQDLRGMGSPEYIVVPSRRLCNMDKLGYVVVKKINAFSILQKKEK